MNTRIPESNRNYRKSSNGPIALFKVILIGIIGAWLGISIWGGISGDIGIVNVHAAIYPALFGKTELDFPPFGSMSARTHKSPVKINLRIDQVHIEETAQWLKKHKSPQQTADMLEKGFKHIAYRMVFISLVIAAFCSLISCWLCRYKGRYLVIGTISGILGVVLPLTVAACTYNTDAFDSPDFRGEMSRAPHLFNIAQRAWKNNSGIIQDIPRIASRTAAMYEQLGNEGYNQYKNPQQCCKVLLISDLHNNPMAVRFALNIARTYKVNLILITGDFTDLGHPLEAHLLSGLKKITVPMVGVTGNHDSRSTIKALAAIPGLTMLDNGKTVKKGRLIIMGFGDPASRRSDTGSVDNSSRKLRRLSIRINNRLNHTKMPDILMVHNNKVGDQIAGRVPLIVDGHLHTAYVKKRHGSVVINPGTTGAAGIRYFSAKAKPEYTAAVLHFSPGPDPKIRMVDSIKMELPSGDFTVTRQSIGSNIRHSR